MRSTRYLLCGLLSFISLSLSGKSNNEGSDVIKLRKSHSHYVFNSKINDKSETTVLLESGIPAMLADSAFVFSNGILAEYPLIATKGEKINLGGKIYNISYKTNGAVKISDNVSYNGEIFILSNYAKDYEVALPIQMLNNEIDRNSRIVHLSLSDNEFKMLSKRELRKLKEGCDRYRMNTESYMEMPSINTEILIDYSDSTRSLQGNFVIDFGNPELLFLMDQNIDVQSFIKENPDIKLRAARNPKGDIIAQFMFADKCEICDAEFTDAVILITKALPRFTGTGNLGLKFFRSFDVIFDFDRNYMYITKDPGI